MSTKYTLFKLFSILVVLAMLFSSLQPVAVQAQGGDGIRKQVNAESGKLSFIGPESGHSVAAAKALGTLLRPQDPGMALAKRFAPEFGVKNPESDLSVMKSHLGEDGQLMLRYQQKYQGVPVMGGELIVNTNDKGDLYSMNGEVSPDLSLSIQPTIDAAQARDTALQAIAKWYTQGQERFVVSEPELWIYDESLLFASTRPAELVWRMEVTPKDGALPIRELVLVNAQRGTVSLHFNQIDTAWTKSKKSNFRFSHKGASDVIAKTWYVATTGDDSNSCLIPTSPCSSIQSAIYKAASGDTIEVAIGTYTSASNDVIAIDRSVTLLGGWDSTFTTQSGMSILDGQNTRRVVDVVPFANATIDHFMIQNGQADQGAGIFNSSILTLNNSVVQNNTATNGASTVGGNGGGIYNDTSSTLTINNSTIKTNLATFSGTVGAGGNGGGIVNFGGSVVLNNANIDNNTATYQGYTPENGGAGGGIFTGGSVTINNSTIQGNKALHGGGLATSSENLMITASTIMYNRSSNEGGGIYQYQGNIALSNVTMSTNIARASGGAVYIYNGSTIINNSTISQNFISNTLEETVSGGGVSNPFDKSVTLKNTIIAGNAAGSAPDCLGKITSAGNNLVGYGADCLITPASGDQIGARGAPLDANLGNLANNGGPTYTYALLAGSPAIDAGNNATCATTDQRGVARPQGVRCDIGAFEGSVVQSVHAVVRTYTANNNTALPGIFLCDYANPTCTAGDSDAKAAHKYALGTYNFYRAKQNRNGIDQNNMPIISSVHYDIFYANAFWSGSQMVYGDLFGFSSADDVVGHELTHGVTQYESNLVYLYQSGAINESFSDLWGEYFDQTNGQGNDGSGVKWQIGEDITYLGSIRSMSNPPAYNNPDKMSSPYYQRLPQYDDNWDNGGVHSNSGVNNKAVYLMVDGGSFNGKTITGLGWDKVGAIYYEVNTNLLTSGADYSDLYYALQQACNNLIGQKGITGLDCAQVKNAIDAVEMNGQPVPNFNSDAPLCSTSGTVPQIVFADDLENGTTNWSFTNGDHPRWQLDSSFWGPYAQSGKHSLYADDNPPEVTDAKARLIPIAIPANAYLWFAQAYEFEYDANGYYDGGVLEYTTNSGSTWQDAGALIQYNGYTGTIYNGAGGDNPLRGKNAFVGSSHGYISTRLNLSSLAGNTVSFRWRMGLDTGTYFGGWWVDNVKVYTCGIFADVPTSHWAWSYIERLYNAGITSGCGINPPIYCPSATVTRDQMAIFLLRGKHGSNYVPPAATGVFQDVPTGYWAADWIEQLAAEGITTGCSVSPKLYCPTTAVTRDQMAVFLLRAKHGAGYVPPAPSGVFADVSTDYWAAAWIEALAAEGVTAGCGNNNYCPGTPVTRDQMAVFLVRNFNLP